MKVLLESFITLRPDLLKKFKLNLHLKNGIYNIKGEISNPSKLFFMGPLLVPQKDEIIYLIIKESTIFQKTHIFNRPFCLFTCGKTWKRTKGGYLYIPQSF